MNVASLQIEDLMMAIASLNNLLVHKGLLSVDDIDVALRKAEAGVTGDERVLRRHVTRQSRCYLLPDQTAAIGKQCAVRG